MTTLYYIAYDHNSVWGRGVTPEAAIKDAVDAGYQLDPDRRDLLKMELPATNKKTHNGRPDVEDWGWLGLSACTRAVYDSVEDGQCDHLDWTNDIVYLVGEKS